MGPDAKGTCCAPYIYGMLGSKLFNDFTACICNANLKLQLEKNPALRGGWDRSRSLFVCWSALWWSRANVGLKQDS